RSGPNQRHCITGRTLYPGSFRRSHWGKPSACAFLGFRLAWLAVASRLAKSRSQVPDLELCCTAGDRLMPGLPCGRSARRRSTATYTTEEACMRKVALVGAAAWLLAAAGQLHAQPV